jgi:predicted dehydrogenase
MNKHTGTNRRIRVGIAGLGGFGSLHVGVLARAEGADLVAVCDPDSTRLSEIAERHGVPKRYTSYEELLAASGVEALFLVTPEHLHAGMVLQALEAGIHTFVEKPFATNVADAVQMRDRATDTGLRLQVGHVLRFEAQHAILHEQIASGAIGRPLTIRAKRNTPASWMELNGTRAHVAIENLVHDADQILWNLPGQRCEKVYAVERYVTGRKFPDLVHAILQFSGGTVVSLETGWTVPDGAPANIVSDNWGGHIDASLDIVGTTSTAELRVFRAGLTLWGHSESIIPNSTLWPLVHGQIGGALRDEDSHFLSTVRTGQNSTVASLDDAIHGIEILTAVVESARIGAEVTL